MRKNLNGRRYYLSGYHLSIVGECPCQSHVRTLEGIKDDLQALSERSGAAGYRENDADVHAMSELAEDLRDALIEYQVSPGPPPPAGRFA